MDGFGLDLKLGARMLLKYWGLTFAGGLALTIAIGIGAGWYDLTGELLHPTLPFSEGDRIVQIDMLNSLTRQDERRLLHDFLGWRRDVESITDLGAFRSLERNLIIDVVLLTSAVMLTVGVAACLEPARRALRIQPADALKTV